MSLSPTADNCWDAKSQRIEKILLRMVVLQLILYIGIKERGIRRVYMNSTGGRLMGSGRQQSGEICWIGLKVKQRDTCFFRIGGQLIINIYT